MLGVDEQAQKRWRAESRKESQRETLRRNLEHDIETNTISVQADNGHDVSNALEQMGRPMTRQQFIDKLILCNRRLVFEEARADPTKWGVYVQTDGPEGKLFICGMEAGIMPEMSILHKTVIKKPNPDLIGNTNPTRDIDWIDIETFAGETRGWRTVLARLLHARLITESDVTKHFGWTPHRPSEKWYNATRYIPGE